MVKYGSHTYIHKVLCMGETLPEVGSKPYLGYGPTRPYPKYGANPTPGSVLTLPWVGPHRGDKGRGAREGRVVRHVLMVVAEGRRFLDHETPHLPL